MKHSFYTGLLCTSLLVFTVGCGKESKSGSGSSYNPYNQNNPYYQNPTQQTQAAITNLQAWYQSSTENSGSIGQKTERRQPISFTEASCSTKTILGFIDINYCKNSQQSTGSVVSRAVYIVSGQVKSQNSKLATALSPGNGATLVSATETNSPVNYSTGRLFTLNYAKSNGHIIQYKIDTGLNSAFNPVEIYDSEARTGEYVLNPQQLLY